MCPRGYQVDWPIVDGLLQEEEEPAVQTLLDEVPVVVVLDKMLLEMVVLVVEVVGKTPVEAVVLVPLERTLEQLGQQEHHVPLVRYQYEHSAEQRDNTHVQDHYGGIESWDQQGAFA